MSSGYYATLVKYLFVNKHLSFLLIFPLVFHSLAVGQPVISPNVNARLYRGTGDSLPLIVGLGGSEGGNAWASDYWKPTRDSFLAQGYAFLALGYFGSEGTPKILDRIAINQVYDAIMFAAQQPGINKNRIAIIGGSRGGDLALWLASLYPEIRCVVAIVPSHVTFPGHTSHFATPAWTWQGKDLAFVPVNETAVPFLLRQDLRGAFETMLLDTAAVNLARIPVEQIKGPVFLLSAKADKICPSTPMCDYMMETFRREQFHYHYEHLAVEGGHGEPLKQFDRIHQFLELWFRNVDQSGIKKQKAKSEYR